MRRTLLAIVGLAVLGTVTFANPMVGNVLGFCPPAEGAKAVGIDGVVAAIDLTAGWLIYRAVRS